MPNWVYNNFTASPVSPKEKRKFEKCIRKGNLFEKFLPIPSELSYDKRVEEEVEAYPWWKDASQEQKDRYLKGAITKKEADRLVSLYGAYRGYDWCIENWGTKWDISDSSLISEDIPNDHVEGTFNTPWSPPIKGLATISEQFPDTVFTLSFVEEDAYYGVAVIKNGTVFKRFGDKYLVQEEFWKEQHKDLFNRYEATNKDDDARDELEDELLELWYEEEPDLLNAAQDDLVVALEAEARK